MKKLFFFCLAFAATGFVMKAQHTRIGFTAGASFSNYHAKVDGETDDGNTLTGLTAGVLVEVPIAKNFSFQPAANFVQKGTKDEQTFEGVTEKVKLTVNAIEVPLNFVYNTTSNSGSFFIGAGPSFAFAVSGKASYDDGTTSVSDDLNFGNSDDDDLKGLDMGANFLAGFRFPNGLFIAANYNTGLSNLLPGGSADGTLKSHYFGIKLGFLLKGKAAK
jgi:Outer membrane protein beta-barrel domain